MLLCLNCFTFICVMLVDRDPSNKVVFTSSRYIPHVDKVGSLYISSNFWICKCLQKKEFVIGSCCCFHLILVHNVLVFNVNYDG